jgi:hypothetical protein
MSIFLTQKQMLADQINLKKEHFVKSQNFFRYLCDIQNKINNHKN